RLLLELVERPEPDRLRRTGLGAGGGQTLLQPVVTEGAFLRDALGRAHVDDAERAGADAVAAAVAGRLLDVDGVELRAHDRPRRAHVKARRVDAVLAHVRHHQPGRLAAVGAEAL